VFNGKSFDQNFQVVERVRVRARWKFSDAALGKRAPPLRTTVMN